MFATKRFQQSTPCSGVKVCQVVAGFVNPNISIQTIFLKFLQVCMAKKTTAEALQKPKKLILKVSRLYLLCHLSDFWGKKQQKCVSILRFVFIDGKSEPLADASMFEIPTRGVVVGSGWAYSRANFPSTYVSQNSKTRAKPPRAPTKIQEKRNN